MLRRNKRRIRKQADSLEVYGSSEEQIFEHVSREVFAKADAFMLDDDPKVTLLQINNIDPDRSMGFRADTRHLSPPHLDALLETIYAGFGVVSPADDPSKWVYNERSTEHVATTPTDFGFDIVETRFRLEDSDPTRLPSPHACGFYTLDLVRPAALPVEQ